jgi:glycerol uptake facilitator-like aquaporin
MNSSFATTPPSKPVNTLPTGAILTVLILTFGPASSAHFNPAVSIAFALRRELPWPEAAAYVAVQIAGGVIGVWAAHLMFELPVWQVSLHARTGTGQWLAEFVATFGLLFTILGCAARNASAIPYAVGLYITSAYWFTASTSFANCTLDFRYVCRHRPRWRHGIRGRAACRDDRGADAGPLVLDAGESMTSHDRIAGREPGAIVLLL